MIEMRHGFNQRQPVFGFTYRSFEQNRKTFRRCSRGFQVFGQALKRGVVILDQSAHPHRQAGERQFMAR